MNFFYTNPLGVITGYYTVVILWSFFIYRFRNTLLSVKKIILEYKYDVSKDKAVVNKTRVIFYKMIYKISFVILITLLFSFAVIIYLELLGYLLFFLVTIPLGIIVYLILLIQGMYNNEVDKDIHRNKTMLG